jgi:hypothetical protein
MDEGEEVQEPVFVSSFLVSFFEDVSILDELTSIIFRLTYCS